MAKGFGVAAISLWEVAMLAEKHRISLDAETLQWLREATVAADVAIFDLTVEIAARAVALPSQVGRDPVDRLIVATAIEYGAPLVTKDERIRRAKLVETIW
jgi:PIN domain nuclease of toxin-antitoxin system